MISPDAELSQLVTEVQQSAKYRTICPDLVAMLAERELAHRGNWREALKAVKRKLHQVGGAYAIQPMRYGAWLSTLRAARSQGRAALQHVCRQIMAAHASSRERLPILEGFYAEALHTIAPLCSILDVACGLNPLAIPWMPLAPGAQYIAYDMYTDLMRFVQDLLPVFDVEGEAQAWNVLQTLPTRGNVDCALLLKTIPCLEQLDPAAGERLLSQLPARHILVSYPVASLGGRDKGMLRRYEEHLTALVGQHPWQVQRFVFETELAFLISKA